MAYALEGVKWHTGSASSEVTVSWSFADLDLEPTLAQSFPGYPDFSSTIAESYRGIIRQAFSIWDAVADIDFVEVGDSTSSQVRLGNHVIDGSGSTLATADYWFNGSGDLLHSAISFDVDAYNNLDTLLWTAVHEIGHAIGLAHSDTPDDVMYYLLAGQDALSQDDVAGAQFLYGPENDLRVERVVDRDNRYPYAFTEAAYEADGDLVRYSVVSDSGAWVDYLYDPNDAGAWKTITAEYNTAGAIQSYAATMDDGSSWTKTFDPGNTKPWSQTVAEFDAGGNLRAYTVFQDDGWQFTTLMDTQNAVPWSSTSAEWAPNGQLGVYTARLDDGTSWKKVFDWNSSQPWSYIAQEFDAAGKLMSEITVFDDGTRLF